MLRLLTYGTAALLIALPGLVHGTWTGRWSRPQGVEQAVAALERVPRAVGAWEGQDLEIDRREVARAGLDGCLMRRYEHRRDGRQVVAILVCGRPGPVAVHTPDICMPGAGFDLVAPPARCQKAADAPQPADFWTARFQKDEAAVPLCRRVSWSWTGDGVWQAPDQPRLTFARFNALYKLYLIQEVSRSDGQTPEEDCDDFIRDLLPELTAALFPSA